MKFKISLFTIMFSENPENVLLEWEDQNLKTIDTIVSGDEVDLSILDIGDSAIVAFIKKPVTLIPGSKERQITINGFTRMS